MPRADPDRACPHRDFAANVNVFRLDEDQDGLPKAYTAEVTVRCANCDEPFRWIGLPYGSDPQRPMVSINEEELRAPLRPSSRDADFGVGIPAYHLRLGDDE